MEQKIAFIREWESGKFYFNSLCEAYGISRQAGYKIINRYKEHGIKSFEDQSRCPHYSPGSSSEQVINLVKDWRKKKGWGAKKIRVKIVEVLGEQDVRSMTT